VRVHFADAIIKIRQDIINDRHTSILTMLRRLAGCCSASELAVSRDFSPEKTHVPVRVCVDGLEDAGVGLVSSFFPGKVHATNTGTLPVYARVLKCFSRQPAEMWSRAGEPDWWSLISRWRAPNFQAQTADLL